MQVELFPCSPLRGIRVRVLRARACMRVYGSLFLFKGNRGTSKRVCRSEHVPPLQIARGTEGNKGNTRTRTPVGTARDLCRGEW